MSKDERKSPHVVDVAVGDNIRNRRRKLKISQEALAAAIGLSLWIITVGVVIEPPAGLMEAINRSNARLLRWSRLGRPVATT